MNELIHLEVLPDEQMHCVTRGEGHVHANMLYDLAMKESSFAAALTAAVAKYFQTNNVSEAQIKKWFFVNNNKNYNP